MKTDLKQKIRQQRQKQMEQLEEKRKKLEEQIALEEGDESFDDAIDESDSSNSDNEEGVCLLKLNESDLLWISNFSGNWILCPNIQTLHRKFF